MSYGALQLRPDDWVVSQTSASDIFLTKTWRTKQKLPGAGSGFQKSVRPFLFLPPWGQPLRVGLFAPPGARP